MMYCSIRTLILVAAGILSSSITELAMATPAFSRQIDADCRTCHFQDMHGLNKFGREFKLNAFRLSRHMKEQLKERRKKEAAADSEDGSL